MLNLPLFPLQPYVLIYPSSPYMNQYLLATTTWQDHRDDATAIRPASRDETAATQDWLILLTSLTIWLANLDNLISTVSGVKRDR